MLVLVFIQLTSRVMDDGKSGNFEGRSYVSGGLAGEGGEKKKKRGLVDVR